MKDGPLAINYAELMARTFPEVRSDYTWKDCVIYALGLGIGGDPLAPDELRHVYENAIEALPTMAVTLGHPGFWISEPDTGIDYRKAVHGEQSLIIHKPLKPAATLLARNSIEEIIDKGEGRGALLRMRRDLFEAETGVLQSTQIMSMFCRGDGGFGGPAGTKSAALIMPDRKADLEIDRATPMQAALIYRLAGDFNPLHADPEVARAAGFERPIFHGLGTFGLAGFALMLGCQQSATALREIGCRFTAPFFPGETLRTEIWQENNQVLFRCKSLERDVTVLDQGRAVFAH